MEDFKIEHFKRDNPDKEFPHFEPLKPDQAKEIYTKLSDRIGEFLPPDQLVKKIIETGDFVESDNAENDDFILRNVFDKIGINPKSIVYLNWHHFDNIDSIRFDDLNNYFDDIWYPSSDDIDIFDSTFSWVLSVCHDGSIKFFKL